MSIFKVIEKEFNKEYKLLNEGIEEVKKYYPKIDSNKINELIALDPTYKGGNELGKYGKWILSLYNTFLKDKESYIKWEEQKKLGNNFPQPIRKSQEQIEDFDKIPNLLSDFDVMNNKLKVNLNNVKSIAELYKIVNDAKNKGISTNSQVNKGIELIKKSVEKGGKVVFKDNNWIVLVPETLESSVVFGNDTNWCTTTSNGEMYYGYIDEYGGQYFINLNLQTGELYQFHFESKQFMDKNDNRIQIEQIIGNDIKLKKFYLNYLYENYKLHKMLAYFILRLDENPSEQFQLETVKQDGYAIQYINNPSEQVQLEAVKQNGIVIQFINNPTEEMKLESVKQNGFIIKYINNSSEQVQLAAVKEDGRAIKFINNPSEQVQLAAVKRDGYAIEYIKNPTEEMKLAAVKQDGYAIQFINNPSEQVQIEAVKQDGYAIQFINNPSDKVKALYKKLYGKINESFEPKLNDNFWKWFGNSKVVDENGNPLVVYHGTKDIFDIFDISFSGKNTNAKNTSLGFFFTPHIEYAMTFGKNVKSYYLKICNPLVLGYAIRKKKSYDDFNQYKHNGIEKIPYDYRRETRGIYGNDVFKDGLKCIKDTVINNYGEYTQENVKNWRNKVISAGFDGIIVMTGDTPTFETDLIPTIQYIVFEPNQIKSVDNNGNWSSESNNIYEAGSVVLKTRKMPTFIGKSEEETRQSLKDRLKPLQYDIFIDYYDNGLSLDELSQKYNMEVQKLKNFIITMRKKVSSFDPDKPLNPNIDYENGRFKKGANPWNKDKRGYMGANKTSFTTDTIKHAEIGKPRQGHQHLVTATDEKIPVKDKHSGKTYMHHKRESYPRWLLKQNGIEVPKGSVVWHLDGDYTNNDLDNLEVITRAEAIKRIRLNRMRNK